MLRIAGVLRIAGMLRAGAGGELQVPGVPGLVGAQVRRGDPHRDLSGGGRVCGSFRGSIDSGSFDHGSFDNGIEVEPTATDREP